MRRSSEGGAEIAAAGIKPLVADITRGPDLAKLPAPFDWVVNTVSSEKGGEEEYREVYLNGTRNLIEWLAPTPIKKYVYTSSTSVYGQTNGSLVKESSPTEPASPTSRLLVETEKLILDAAQAKKFPAVILRVAGIYGPERGHLFLQYLRNEARIAGKGERFLNMIHRDDLVSVIIAALKSGRPGEVYNATDDEPVAQIHFFRWLSETLGKWMPPFATEEESSGRKRGLTNKKVSNRKLRMELGVGFKYPTFRQGYTAEIARLERAGQLDIKPEPR
jgi:nucleoside-diphosphate-sugar epimerase